MQVSSHDGYAAEPLHLWWLNEDLLVESELFDYFKDYQLFIIKAAATVP